MSHKRSKGQSDRDELTSVTETTSPVSSASSLDSKIASEEEILQRQRPYNTNWIYFDTLQGNPTVKQRVLPEFQFSNATSSFSMGLTQHPTTSTSGRRNLK